MEQPTTVSQDEAPCILHKTHSPVTVVNELHHPFPQEWQRKIWGKTMDNRMVSICATSHNTVHRAIYLYERTGVWPSWCVGPTRDLAEQAFLLRAAALDSM